MNGNSKYPLVMLVDDNELDILVNKKLIESENFSSRLISHQSSQSGIDYLKNTSNPDENPNIIFLDIMMPGLDGFGFLDEFGKLDDSIKMFCCFVLFSFLVCFKHLNRANQSPYCY